MKPGDVVRINATKKEGIVGSIDGDSALVMTNEGGHVPVHKWMKTSELSQPIDKENVKPKDVKHWLFR